MNLGTNDLLIEAERQLAESATRLDLIVVLVCLGGVLLLGWLP